MRTPSASNLKTVWTEVIQILEGTYADSFCMGEKKVLNEVTRKARAVENV